MDPKTAKLLLFIGFSLICFLLGHQARKRGWASEARSRPLHLHTVIWAWSPVSLLAFWRLPITGEAGGQALLLMLSQPPLMVAGALVMLAIAAAAGWRGQQRGVLIIGAAIANHGFTLGAYLCYALLEPAEQALSYGIAYVTSMQLFMILLFYPVAHHYGPEEGRSLGRLIAGSFWTPRAAPLYMAIAGVALNLTGAPFPGWVDAWHVMELLFFAGAAGAYTGIGLRCRLGDWHGLLGPHAALFAVQFLAHPLLAIGWVALLHAAGPVPEPLVRDVIVVEAFAPTALNTVMISNLFHLDARMASALWLWNTLAFCVIPLPLLTSGLVG